MNKRTFFILFVSILLVFLIICVLVSGCVKNIQNFETKKQYDYIFIIPSKIRWRGKLTWLIILLMLLIVII